MKVGKYTLKTLLRIIVREPPASFDLGVTSEKLSYHGSSVLNVESRASNAIAPDDILSSSSRVSLLPTRFLVSTTLSSVLFLGVTICDRVGNAKGPNRTPGGPLLGDSDGTIVWSVSSVVIVARGIKSVSCLAPSQAGTQVLSRLQ